MKSKCGNGLTWFFGIAASHKQCQFFDVDEVADKNDEGNWWWQKWWKQERDDDDDDEDEKDEKDDEDDGHDEDNEDAEAENEDGDYDEQGCCRVPKSIQFSKRKPPNAANAVIVSGQVCKQKKRNIKKKRTPNGSPISA